MNQVTTTPATAPVLYPDDDGLPLSEGRSA
jgi:hypothetical protein